jgi:hypothetical protein
MDTPSIPQVPGNIMHHAPCIIDHPLAHPRCVIPRGYGALNSADGRRSFEHSPKALNRFTLLDSAIVESVDVKRAKKLVAWSYRGLTIKGSITDT